MKNLAPKHSRVERHHESTSRNVNASNLNFNVRECFERCVNSQLSELNRSSFLDRGRRPLAATGHLLRGAEASLATLRVGVGSDNWPLCPAKNAGHNTNYQTQRVARLSRIADRKFADQKWRPQHAISGHLTFGVRSRGGDGRYCPARATETRLRVCLRPPGRGRPVSVACG